MQTAWQRYLLFCDTDVARDEQRWRFVLTSLESQQTVSASAPEPGETGERLELLSAVRGLEALDGPALVTMFTTSNYVCRGIQRDLAEWRENDWQWEHFDQLIPVRDADLWRRIDRALQFHFVECRRVRAETVESAPRSYAIPQALTTQGEEMTARRAPAARPQRVSAFDDPPLLIVRGKDRGAATLSHGVRRQRTLRRPHARRQAFTQPAAAAG